MDTNTLIAIVIAAIVVIIGFIIYRRKAKVDVDVPGGKLKFEGGNSATSGEAKPRNRSNGIFGNLSIGKTRVEVKGECCRIRPSQVLKMG